MRRCCVELAALGIAMATIGGCMTIYERYHIKASARLGRSITPIVVVGPGIPPIDPGFPPIRIPEDSNPSTETGPTPKDDAKGPVVSNYYRITISGWTLFSTSQYSAGWYDAEAVDSLFGELKGKTVMVDRVALEGHTPRTPPSEKKEDETVTKIESMDGQQLTNKKLVLFLSSNADSLANQISALATKKEVEVTLSAMLASGDFEEREGARVEDAAAAEKTNVLAQELRVILAGIDSAAPSGPKVRQTLQILLRALARSSNTPEDLGSIGTTRESALSWFTTHPEAFRLPGGGR
jgi:hypothetical protein